MKVLRIGALTMVLGVPGCDPAEDVEVLPLPALERPSPEARLGLPEVQGVWRFAGWEIIEGDSTALERTFPSFGALSIEAQRLDSIAGTFELAGGPARVVGDVRRTGLLTLVTIAGGAPASYLAGEYDRDTLWLELTSVLAPDEWPQDARAAFVREPVSEPIAWLRGARVAEEPPREPAGPGATIPGQQPGLGVPGAAQQPGQGIPGAAQQPGVGQPGGQRPATQPQPAGPAGGAGARPGQPSPGPGAGPSQQPAVGPPASVGAQPPAGQRPPGAGQQPAGAQPGGPAGGQPAPGAGAQPQATDPEPEPRDPEPEPPEPDIQIPEPNIPPLLGDPVQQERR